MLEYGIKADSSKGRNVGYLRYLLYDRDMLIRHEPRALAIKQFKMPAPSKNRASDPISIHSLTGDSVRINYGVNIFNTLSQVTDGRLCRRLLFIWLAENNASRNCLFFQPCQTARIREAGMRTKAEARKDRAVIHVFN